MISDAKKTKVVSPRPRADLQEQDQDQDEERSSQDLAKTIKTSAAPPKPDFLHDNSSNT